jgi:hypothetical protein
MIGGVQPSSGDDGRGGHRRGCTDVNLNGQRATPSPTCSPRAGCHSSFRPAMARTGCRVPAISSASGLLGVGFCWRSWGCSHPAPTATSFDSATRLLRLAGSCRASPSWWFADRPEPPHSPSATGNATRWGVDTFLRSVGRRMACLGPQLGPTGLALDAISLSCNGFCRRSHRFAYSVQANLPRRSPPCRCSAITSAMLAKVKSWACFLYM